MVVIELVRFELKIYGGIELEFNVYAMLRRNTLLLAGDFLNRTMTGECDV